MHPPFRFCGSLALWRTVVAYAEFRAVASVQDQRFRHAPVVWLIGFRLDGAEAIEAIGGLISPIVLMPEDGRLQAAVLGDLTALLSLASARNARGLSGIARRWRGKWRWLRG